MLCLYEVRGAVVAEATRDELPPLLPPPPPADDDDKTVDMGGDAADLPCLCLPRALPEEETEEWAPEDADNEEEGVDGEAAEVEEDVNSEGTGGTNKSSGVTKEKET